jgi:hypothetical protein
MTGNTDFGTFGRFTEPGSTGESPRVCRHLNEKVPSDLG